MPNLNQFSLLYMSGGVDFCYVWIIQHIETHQCLFVAGTWSNLLAQDCLKLSLASLKYADCVDTLERLQVRLRTLTFS